MGPSDPSDPSDPFDTFSKASGEMYRAWEKGLASWWDQVVESEPFLDAMNQSLAANARARGEGRKAMDAAMTAMNLPTREDLTRVARIASLLEDKLLGIEDRLLHMTDELREARKEAMVARAEALEARVELRERLDLIAGIPQ